MEIEQKQWTLNQDWQHTSETTLSQASNLVLVFGQRELLEDETHFDDIHQMYPKAHILLSSTSGEIMDKNVLDNSISCTAISFDSTRIQVAEVVIEDFEGSFEAGQKIIEKITQEGLKHIFLLSDGLLVNGTQLINGVNSVLADAISITGGLAGDAASFEKTVVGLNQVPRSGNIVLVGFYGEKFKVGCGSVGGWHAFGIERTITKSIGNQLYELDGKPALRLYKSYLGDEAENLPASGLLFPLSIRKDMHDTNSLVRTILAVDEETQSLTFAGDVPQGHLAKLMRANFAKLIDGAKKSAQNSLDILENNQQPSLAILVSCVGRKLLMQDKIQEEVEGVRQIIGEKVSITGFYSYGELAPSRKFEKCNLHNQTMTITLLSEE